MITKNLSKKEIEERIEALIESQEEGFNEFREKNLEQLKARLKELK